MPVSAPFDLTGKVALVTGASRGLGQYMGRALARAGADLVITSRSLAHLEPFRAEVASLGRTALPVRARRARLRSAVPPPNRNTDQRVLNEQFVTVTNWQLPNNAQASS